MDNHFTNSLLSSDNHGCPQLIMIQDGVRQMCQCFHNRLFKNPFTISKIPFFPTAGKFVAHAPDSIET